MYIPPFACGAVVGAFSMAVVLIVISICLSGKNKPRG